MNSSMVPKNGNGMWGVARQILNFGPAWVLVGVFCYGGYIIATEHLANQAKILQNIADSNLTLIQKFDDLFTRIDTKLEKLNDRIHMIEQWKTTHVETRHAQDARQVD